MPEQEQFLQVLDRDEAERRFRAALDLSPRGAERVPLDAALGRVLAADVVSPVDVPSFDRSPRRSTPEWCRPRESAAGTRSRLPPAA